MSGYICPHKGENLGWNMETWSFPPRWICTSLVFEGFLELLNFPFSRSYCALGTVGCSAEAEISVQSEEVKWAHVHEAKVSERLP